MLWQLLYKSEKQVCVCVVAQTLYYAQKAAQK